MWLIEPVLGEPDGAAAPSDALAPIRRRLPPLYIQLRGRKRRFGARGFTWAAVSPHNFLSSGRATLGEGRAPLSRLWSSPLPIYEASPKHCEPLTAERPGLKCPAWSRDIAQQLLDASVEWGNKRVATYRGVAFVAQRTTPNDDVWHGYPEGWDKIEFSIKMNWLRAGLIKRRHLRQFATRRQMRDAFGGSLYGGN